MRTTTPGRALPVTAVCRLLFLVLTSGPLVAQTLFVDSADAVNSRPGMNIAAHYDLGKDFTWCDPADIRWIQNVSVTDNKGTAKSIAGFPASFVDPLPGQDIGNDYDGNAQTGDTLPWYDITRNQAAKTGAFQRGAGAFYEDAPGGAAFNDNAPIRVEFNTLVVCLDTAKNTFAPLGGFSWGFVIDPKDSNPQVLAVGGVNADNLVDAFNDLIKNGTSLDGKTKFEQWTMIKGDPKCQLTLKIIPEPSGMVAIGLACLAFGIVCRRRIASARPS